MLTSERPGLASERPGLASYGASKEPHGAQTDRQMYRFPLYSTGLHPLRGRCFAYCYHLEIPKQARVPMTISCLWATGSPILTKFTYFPFVIHSFSLLFFSASSYDWTAGKSKGKGLDMFMKATRDLSFLVFLAQFSSIQFQTSVSALAFRPLFFLSLNPSVYAYSQPTMGRNSIILTRGGIGSVPCLLIHSNRPLITMFLSLCPNRALASLKHA